MSKVVIIGGGISGLCSAYYLVKEGHQVTVLDKGDMASGASFINAGYVVPSHFISLAAPGMISKGIKWMFNSSSPFYMKPRFDMDFFSWALKFAKAATAEKVEKAIPVIKDINLKSSKLYQEIRASEDFAFHYEHRGLLMAFLTEHAEKEELEVADRAVREGLEARLLNREELQRVQPVFSKDVLGAVHYQCDSHLTPGQFMLQLRDWLGRNGVGFECHQEVTSLHTTSGKITVVETASKSFPADEVVLTAGSWTSQLAKSLGLKIPIQGGKGYSMDAFGHRDISIPAILVEAKVAVTPMNGFTRFAGTMEFSGNNAIIRKNRVEAIARSVEKYYRGVKLSAPEKEAAVSGLRPVSPDGLPFLGRTQKYSNLVVAAGHGMMGWSLGPITGKIVSEIISGQPSSVNLKPFNVDRYQ